MLAGQERKPDRAQPASRRHVVNHTHEQGGAGAPQGANENALSATLKRVISP